MRLAMTLLVKNERDIIGANLDFHLNAGVDHVIVTDNSSDDGTRDVLSRYARLPEVTVWDEAGDDYSQHRWVTRMALVASQELGARWIINVDADEFWTHPSGTLAAAFDHKAAHVLVCERRNMVCALDADERTPWWTRLVYRAHEPSAAPSIDPVDDAIASPFLLQRLCPKVAARGEGLVRVHQGNHAIDHAVPVLTAPSDVAIYHYPVRSRAQFVRKIEQGGAAYARNKDLPVSIGWHWRRWHRMLRDRIPVVEVVAEALPTASALTTGLADGSLVLDESMVEPLRACMSGAGSLRAALT